MPKASSLTLSLSKEQGRQKSSVPHDGQRSPIRATGDSGSASRSDMAAIPDQDLRDNLEIPDSPKTNSSSGMQRKPVPGSRTAPSAIPTTTLDPPQIHLHPYHDSPASSIASMSHGNLLETASIASGSVVETASEPAESETGFKSNSLPRADAEHMHKSSRRPNKQVFQQIMSRSRSIRQENNGGHHVPKLNTRGRFFESSRSRERPIDASPRTAPLEPDRSYREAMSSSNTARNRSADRVANDADENEAHRPATSRFAHLMNSSTKAAGDIGRAGKGFFGKFARSGSSHERDIVPIDENYVIKTINLPLVEQTRKTRIRQRMSEAKDKTEFWLPALPYRCIDYLNLKGCEVEGLYRVPGSVREIKHWQARFDSELDVNLLDVPDLDDVNTIGSLLKAWLRDQPDELIPHAVQKKIAAECAEASATGQTPQMFKDELSKLPPFNYYLLFAITAHLALLQKHSELNKMDYRNLCICFQPCMNLDPIAFQFLVKDWRNCWQGCWPEKEYLDEEYRVMRGGSPSQSRSGASTTSTNETTALPPMPGQRDAPSSAPSEPVSRPGKSKAPQAAPLSLSSLRLFDEADQTSSETRMPPPAPQSSPQLPQTPTSPII